jgi:hypothetical protein
MPAPLAPGLREAILTDIRAGGKPRNQIAREHHVSPSTVSAIARKEGLLGSAFDRTKTQNASRAKAADNRARRAQLQSDLLYDAQRLRGRAWEPCQVVASGPEGVEIIELSLPPLPDVRAAYTAIGICVDKDAAIERASAAGEGTAEAESLMGRLAAALTEAVGGGTETMPDDS